MPFHSIDGHQVYLIFTKKLFTLPSLPVTSFDNRLDFFENLNILSSSIGGSKYAQVDRKIPTDHWDIQEKLGVKLLNHPHCLRVIEDLRHMAKAQDTPGKAKINASKK